MPLGNVVLSRHPPLGVSERAILHFRKFGYADIHKRGGTHQKNWIRLFSHIISVHKRKKAYSQDSRELF